MHTQGPRARRPGSRRSRDSLAEARAAALRLLAYRARSRREMMDRLAQKGFSSPDIESTISSLEKSGLIDDKKLAPELLRAASERKMLGRTGIAVYMKKRGLDQGLIDEVLRDYDDESELMAAFALVEKKLRAMSGCSADQKKKRLWNALRRRGFSHHVIRKAVASAGESG